MGTLTARWLVVLLGASALAQDGESNEELVARVRKGGWIEAASKHQRGDDGALQRWYFADTGAGPGLGRFVPLVPLTPDRHPFDNLGALGLLAVVCHGPGDLLAMTDPGFHFQALGGADDEASLRQLVVLPFDGDGALGQAALLDRQLAVATLLRRGGRGAVAELTMLAEKGKLPPALGEYTRWLLAQRGEGAAAGRRRLDPKTLLLPVAFDACVVVDHARLPDVSFLAGLARRTGILVTTRAIEMAGGTISDAMRNGAQYMADQAAEAPFEMARKYGNVRLDQSCVIVNAKADSRRPVDVTWQAAGEIAAEGWQRADLGKLLGRPFANGVVTFARERLLVSTLDKPGLVREAKATELLADTGAALRVVVPGNSKLLAMVGLLGLQQAKDVELRVTFGDPATFEFVVGVRDEDAAAQWVAKGKELLAQLLEQLDTAPGEVQEVPAWGDLVAAIGNAEFTAKELQAVARVTVPGFTAAKFVALVNALSPGF